MYYNLIYSRRKVTAFRMPIFTKFIIIQSIYIPVSVCVEIYTNWTNVEE